MVLVQHFIAGLLNVHVVSKYSFFVHSLAQILRLFVDNADFQILLLFSIKCEETRIIISLWGLFSSVNFNSSFHSVHSVYKGFLNSHSSARMQFCINVS